MDRLNMRPNERHDKIHTETLLDGVEKALRDVLRVVFPRTAAGAGLISGSCTWNAAAQAFQITDLVAVDIAGNPCIKLGSWFTSAIAPALVGTAPVYIYAAVQPGTTPSSAARRVRRLAGSAEESFHGETIRVDAVQAVPSTVAPADLVAPPAAFFKVFEVTDWSDLANPVIKQVCPLALGEDFEPGSVLGTLAQLAAAITQAKGTANWADSPADTLAGLDGRVTALEDEDLPTRVAALEADQIEFHVPLTIGWYEQGSGSMSLNGVTFAGAAVSIYRVPLALPHTYRLVEARIACSTGANDTMQAVIKSVTTGGVEANVTGGEAWAENTSTDTKLLSPIASPAPIDLAPNRYEAHITANSGASGLARLKNIRVKVQRVA